MFKNRMDNYLVREGYTYIRTCGLLISQMSACPQPSELLLGWQSCYILLNILLHQPCEEIRTGNLACMADINY